MPDFCSRVFQLLHYQITQLLNFFPLLSSFVAVVDHSANFGAEFFLHAADNGVLLGPATAAGPGCQARAAITLVFTRWWRRTGNHFEFDRPAQHSARGGDGQPLPFWPERHVHNSLRLGNLDYQLVALHTPFAS